MIRPRSPRPFSRGCALLAPRAWISAGIVGFFLTMMVLLYRRETEGVRGVRKLGISPDLLTVTWADYEQYMYIERDGQRIGSYMLRVARVPEPKNPNKVSYDLTSRTRMQLKVAGQDVSASTDVVVHMNDLFELDTFQGLLKTLGEEVHGEAFAEGLSLYYRFRLPPVLLDEKDRARGAVVSKVALKEPVMLADAIRPVVTRGDKLKIGSKWTTVGTNPFAGQFDAIVRVEVQALERIELDGRQVPAFRVAETTRAPETGDEVKTTSWYDPAGKVLKTDLGNRITMTRVPSDAVVKFIDGFGLPPNIEEINKDEIRASAAEPAEAGSGRLEKLLQKAKI